MIEFLQEAIETTSQNSDLNYLGIGIANHTDYGKLCCGHEEAISDKKGYDEIAWLDNKENFKKKTAFEENKSYSGSHDLKKRVHKSKEEIKIERDDKAKFEQ
jgi:hypothetical protein